MAGRGTGWPITFACAKCRKRWLYYRTGSPWRYRSDRPGFNYTTTGVVRALTSSQQGNGHNRAAFVRMQYRCDDCGHVGFSRHIEVHRRFVREHGYDPDHVRVERRRRAAERAAKA
jgi:ribosomal protein S14